MMNDNELARHLNGEGRDEKIDALFAVEIHCEDALDLARRTTKLAERVRDFGPKIEQFLQSSQTRRWAYLGNALALLRSRTQELLAEAETLTAESSARLTVLREEWTKTEALTEELFVLCTGAELNNAAACLKVALLHTEGILNNLRYNAIPGNLRAADILPPVEKEGRSLAAHCHHLRAGLEHLGESLKSNLQEQPAGLITPPAELKTHEEEIIERAGAEAKLDGFPGNN